MSTITKYFPVLSQIKHLIFKDRNPFMDCDEDVEVFHVSFLTSFVQFVENNATIQQFLKADKCNLLADNYLLALTFAYFVRAKIPKPQFDTLNFFTALYIAHDMEEDDPLLKRNLCNWTSHSWEDDEKFFKNRKELLEKMNFRACVSRQMCEKVMSMAETKDSPLWKRERSSSHAGAFRPKLKAHVSCENCSGDKVEDRVKRYYQPFGEHYLSQSTADEFDDEEMTDDKSDSTVEETDEENLEQKIGIEKLETTEELDHSSIILIGSPLRLNSVNDATYLSTNQDPSQTCFASEKLPEEITGLFDIIPTDDKADHGVTRENAGELDLLLQKKCNIVKSDKLTDETKTNEAKRCTYLSKASWADLYSDDDRQSDESRTNESQNILDERDIENQRHKKNLMKQGRLNICKEQSTKGHNIQNENMVKQEDSNRSKEQTYQRESQKQDKDEIHKYERKYRENIGSEDLCDESLSSKELKRNQTKQKEIQTNDVVLRKLTLRKRSKKLKENDNSSSNYTDSRELIPKILGQVHKNFFECKTVRCDEYFKRKKIVENYRTLNPQVYIRDIRIQCGVKAEMIMNKPHVLNEKESGLSQKKNEFQYLNCFPENAGTDQVENSRRYCTPDIMTHISTNCKKTTNIRNNPDASTEEKRLLNFISLNRENLKDKKLNVGNNYSKDEIINVLDSDACKSKAETAEILQNCNLENKIQDDQNEMTVGKRIVINSANDDDKYKKMSNKPSKSQKMQGSSCVAVPDDNVSQKKSISNYEKSREKILPTLLKTVAVLCSNEQLNNPKQIRCDPNEKINKKIKAVGSMYTKTDVKLSKHTDQVIIKFPDQRKVDREQIHSTSLTLDALKQEQMTISNRMQKKFGFKQENRTNNGGIFNLEKSDKIREEVSNDSEEIGKIYSNVMVSTLDGILNKFNHTTGENNLKADKGNLFYTGKNKMEGNSLKKLRNDSSKVHTKSLENNTLRDANNKKDQVDFYNDENNNIIQYEMKYGPTTEEKMKDVISHPMKNDRPVNHTSILNEKTQFKHNNGNDVTDYCGDNGDRMELQEEWQSGIQNLHPTQDSAICHNNRCKLNNNIAQSMKDNLLDICSRVVNNETTITSEEIENNIEIQAHEPTENDHHRIESLSENIAKARVEYSNSNGELENNNENDDGTKSLEQIERIVTSYHKIDEIAIKPIAKTMTHVKDLVNGNRQCLLTNEREIGKVDAPQELVNSLVLQLADNIGKETRTSGIVPMDIASTTLPLLVKSIVTGLVQTLSSEINNLTQQNHNEIKNYMDKKLESIENQISTKRKIQMKNNFSSKKISIMEEKSNQEDSFLDTNNQNDDVIIIKENIVTRHDIQMVRCPNNNGVTRNICPSLIPSKPIKLEKIDTEKQTETKKERNGKVIHKVSRKSINIEHSRKKSLKFMHFSVSKKEDPDTKEEYLHIKIRKVK